MFSKFSSYFKRSLFFISSLTAFLSCAIFFLLHNLSNNGADIKPLVQIIPILLGSILALVFLVIYAIWREKEYALIHFHMKKNYLNYDTLAIVFLFLLILSLYGLSFPFFNTNFWADKISFLWILVGYGIVLLIPQGFHLYFLYKVKIDLTQRKKKMDEPNKLDGVKTTDKKQLESNLNNDDSKKATAGGFYEK